MPGSRSGRPEAPFQIGQVHGTDASDLFVHAIPEPAAKSDRAQFRSMAQNSLDGLLALGAVPADVVAGWVYLHEQPSWSARHELAAAWDQPDPERLPLTFLTQPPATSHRFCEMQLHASRRRSDRCSVVWKGSFPGPLCTTVLRAGARRLRMLSLVPRLSFGGNNTLADIAYDMFASASHALTDRGMSFHDVVRTWIHLRDIDRDYDGFNLGRRQFFEAAEMVRLPASTAIQAAHADSYGPLAMDLYAVGGGEVIVEAMLPASMGEASAYGSFFARGSLLREGGQRLAFLSGTASIDQQGRIVAPGDAKGQLCCMFANAAAVLGQAGLGLADAVSVTAYLKSASLLPEFRKAALAVSLPVSVPTATVVADICRPEWLCEIELVAGRTQD